MVQYDDVITAAGCTEAAHTWVGLEHHSPGSCRSWQDPLEVACRGRAVPVDTPAIAAAAGRKLDNTGPARTRTVNAIMRTKQNENQFDKQSRTLVLTRVWMCTMCAKVRSVIHLDTRLLLLNQHRGRPRASSGPGAAAAGKQMGAAGVADAVPAAAGAAAAHRHQADEDDTQTDKKVDEDLAHSLGQTVRARVAMNRHENESEMHC